MVRTKYPWHEAPTLKVSWTSSNEVREKIIDHYLSTNTMAKTKEPKDAISWDSPVETRVRILDHYIKSNEADIKASEHAESKPAS